MSETTQSAVPMPTELTPIAPGQTPANPLSQYFRHTKITIELPSQGKFWPEGSLNLPEGGEVNVMPLTAKDEIILKSPEGLLSGSSVVDSIASCVPAILNPWVMPAIDVDTVFIAIRIASFDHRLEVTTKCTHCGHSNDNELDLRSLLDSIPKGNIQNSKVVDGLTIEFAPYTFEFVNKQNKMKFEQERLARSIAKTADADEVIKNGYFKGVFQELVEHNTESLVVAILNITLPDGTVVDDRPQITEFVNNASRDTIKQIRDGIQFMNESVAMKPVKIICEAEECKKEYEAVVEFNQSNFFD